MRRALLLLLLLAAAAVACQSQTRTVHLTLGDQGEGVDGFLCRQTLRPTQFLIQRVVDSASHLTKASSVVVDFIPLAIDPGCRTSEIVSYCKTNDCSPDLSLRRCIAVPPTPYGTPSDIRSAVVTFLDSNVDGTVLANPAPKGPVLVRLVGTLEDCATVSVTPQFDPSLLFGCAYGGPVDLTVHTGDLFLGFDTLTDACEPAVDVCASADLRIP